MMEDIYLGYVHKISRISENAELWVDKPVPKTLSVTIRFDHPDEVPTLLELSYGLYVLVSSLPPKVDYMSVQYRRADLNSL